MIRQTIDVEFDIERLELGTLQLNFQDILLTLGKMSPTHVHVIEPLVNRIGLLLPQYLLD